MKKRKDISLKVIEYFWLNPNADVKKVAARFKIALPKTYALRKRAMGTRNPVPELLPVPEVKPSITVEVPKNEATVSVDQILDQRAANYGKFIEGAEIMQMIKRMLHNYVDQRGTSLAFDQLEALDMIVHKMGRIVNGNPDVVDHWKDIAGYATLVADRLEGRVR